MKTLEEIKHELFDRRPSIVAAATGIHINTITAIRDGINDNPQHKTLKKLSDYFESREAK